MGTMLIIKVKAHFLSWTWAVLEGIFMKCYARKNFPFGKAEDNISLHCHRQRHRAGMRALRKCQICRSWLVRLFQTITDKKKKKRSVKSPLSSHPSPIILPFSFLYICKLTFHTHYIRSYIKH